MNPFNLAVTEKTPSPLFKDALNRRKFFNPFVIVKNRNFFSNAHLYCTKTYLCPHGDQWITL